MFLFEVFKVFYFGYITCLSYIITLWPLTILPEIMRLNFNKTNSYENGIACKDFFIWFYWGMIAGAFIWPTIIRYLSLRNSVLSALVVQMAATYYMAKTDNLATIFILRLICGLFMNINNVGKAFIFEFAPTELQQWGFSSKNTWGILASFLSPIIGFKVYNLLNKDFASVCIYVSWIYFASIVVFFITFYFLSTFKSKEERDAEEEEERKKLLNEKSLDTNEEKESDIQSLWGISKFIWHHKSLRNFVIVYMITNGCFKTMSLLSVLFLERAPSEQGLGIDSEVISWVAVISIIPSVTLVMISPFFVPKKISYQLFMGAVISFFAFAVIMTPVMRDLGKIVSPEFIFWIACINQSTVYWATPKIFSPFMSYIVGKSVPHEGRTAINSITFILSTVCSALFTQFASEIYEWSMDTPEGQSYIPYNKYISFLAVNFLLFIALYYLSHTRNK